MPRSRSGISASKPTRPPMPMVYPRFHFCAPGSNVTVLARLIGQVDTTSLRTAIDALRRRHPLLDASIHLRSDGTAEFRFGGTPPIDLLEIKPLPGRDPLAYAMEAQTRPFDLATGPLAKILVLRNNGQLDLVLICHHTICDGRSMIMLVRDLLRLLAAPNALSDEPLDPPQVQVDCFPPAARPTRLERLVLGSVNRRWSRHQIEYDRDDYLQLHSTYWETPPTVLTGGLSHERTRQLIDRCRAERVTVHTALCAAFLASSEAVCGSRNVDQRRMSMAIDLRPYMQTPPENGLGLCASALTVNTQVRQGKPFWGEVRRLHGQIQRGLASERSIYGMLALNHLDPSLIDALQFGMHGMVGHRFVDRVLCMMKFDRVRFGLAVTNLGRMAFPAAIGGIEVKDVVFQPPIFPNLEKILGVVTTGGRMRFVLSSHPSSLAPAEAACILSSAIDKLRIGLRSAPSP